MIYRHVEPASGLPRDVDAAVSWALPRVEYASVSTTTSTDGAIVYELVNLKGEPGWLRIEPTSPIEDGAVNPGDEPRVRATERDWSISVRLGRFGHDAQERKLVNLIRARLDALAKSDAP